ncbi:carbamate kinase [Erwinia sp. OLTSP20]|uniref:carbamate kinase n=1 Tax=unclassified Erwinia TaxID=2622719 RepID=UPI000C1745EE|nr:MULTISPECIES: carbamate kinase [unclassified Erwinia]PIJ50081.1 carbamate kinase [Erwinia sp. OAMSP11]PIJ71951.1 carbamate kinase [Erwinia sp. OLSSP12]PIJ80933.1 carbamate kinase [Erwinia sp. OLCASP19]PIJ83838.1 carbamate kinase [Erwinia sp. OLMTSP26]PIJ85996.1 carbamate kinase [Erwinia sp. OLMDSP33]
MNKEKPVLVVAVGGNALLQRGEVMSYENQKKNIDVAAHSLAELNKSWRVVIVHGNGPQVGLLALQGLSYRDVPPYPMDVLGAESQGMIGYMLAQSLKKYIPEMTVSTLLTQVRVDKNDPAFKDPNKFIGPVYSEQIARERAKEFGWDIKPDGEYWRRVVPSPAPQSIVEIDSIHALLAAGNMVICCGGGGCPVVYHPEGPEGVEAVIDKDLSAATLAKQLNAEHFLILTDGDNVCVNWGKPDEKPLYDITVEQIERYKFAAGSMGPKVAACCDFARLTSGTGHIGSLHKAALIMEGKSGTHIHP